MQPRSVSQDPYLSTRVIWIAMLFSLVLYAVVMRVVPQPARPTSLALPLLAASAGLAILSVVVRPRMAGNAQAGYVLKFALAEASALPGLVLHMLAGWPNAWVFVVIGGAALLLNQPRREDFPKG